MGLQVKSANNGIEALDLLEQHRFDLVLMDCQMPEMDGYQATERIRRDEREGTATIPIVALTANAMLEDRERCLAAGMNDYLSKPVTLQLLRDELLRWLGYSHFPPSLQTGYTQLNTPCGGKQRSTPMS